MKRRLLTIITLTLGALPVISCSPTPTPTPEPPGPGPSTDFEVTYELGNGFTKDATSKNSGTVNKYVCDITDDVIAIRDYTNFETYHADDTDRLNMSLRRTNLSSKEYQVVSVGYPGQDVTITQTCIGLSIGLNIPNFQSYINGDSKIVVGDIIAFDNELAKGNIAKQTYSNPFKVYGTSTGSVKKTYSATANVIESQLENYDLEGYYDNPSFTGSKVTSVSESKTLYAKWVKLDKAKIMYQRAAYVANTEWFAAKNFTRWQSRTGGYYAGNHYYGIPYSQPAIGLGYVYWHYTFAEFLNMVPDANSLVYKSYSERGYVMPRIGTDCAAFVSAIYELPVRCDCGFLTRYANNGQYGCANRASNNNVQAGDYFIRSDHVIFVCEVNGQNVTTIESTPALEGGVSDIPTRTRTISWFTTNGYKACSYDGRFVTKASAIMA